VSTSFKSLRVVPSRASRLDVIKRAYAARIVGDGALYAAFFTPDCRYQLIGNAMINRPSGLWLGREGIIAVYQRLAQITVLSDLMIEDVIQDNDSAAVLWHAEIRSVAGGRISDFTGFDHLRFDEDLISELSSFYDSASLAILLNEETGE
jgi:ketosteroid isomerase-like protein